MKRREPLWFGCGRGGDLVLVEDRFQKLGRRQRGIYEKRGDQAAAPFRLFGKDLQSGMKESGLTRADRPSHYDEPLALEDSLEERLERRSMRVG